MAPKSKTIRRVPKRPGRADALDVFEKLVDANASALNLSIDPAWRPDIALNLRSILGHAALVEEFSIADETDPAPVFHA